MLFQRLLAIADRDQVELDSGFSFELKNQPDSLFNKEGFMNTTNKPALADTLWEMTEKPKLILAISNVMYLLDKGDLLNKLLRMKGERYSRFTSIMLTM